MQRLRTVSGCALDQQPAVADRRGEAPAGGEGQARVRLAVGLEVLLAGRLEDRAVGLVRPVVALAHAGGGEFEQFVLAAVVRQRDEPDDAQPVLRQGAGLVEADGVDAAERLQHPGAAHHRTAPGEPPGGGLLGDRRDQRQPLGDGGDGDRQPGRHRLPQRAAPQDAQGGDGGTAGEGEREDGAGELRQPGLHAGRGSRATGGAAGPPGLGGLTDGDDDGPAAAGDDGGALEEHAGAVGDVGAGRRGHRLADRERFAGEAGLVDLQVRYLQQPGVGGEDVAGLDQQDVTEAERGRRHLLGAAVGLPARGVVLLDEQLLEHGLGAQPLQAADDGVDGGDAADEDGVGDVAQHRGGGRAGDQDRRERIGELGGDRAGEAGRHPDRGHLLGAPGERRDAAGPVLGLDGDVGQPAHDLVGLQRVPRGVHRRGGHGTTGGANGGPAAGGHGRDGRALARRRRPALAVARAAHRGEQRAEDVAGDRGTGDAAAHRLGDRDGGDDPAGVGEAGEGDEVGAPGRRPAVEHGGDRDVGGHQRRSVGRRDQEDAAPVLLQAPDGVDE